jgi:ClpP class serine protease
MNTVNIQDQLELERRWLQELRADIPTMAATIAEDVTDDLERAIDEETENGMFWDVADAFKNVLLLGISDSFEAHVDKTALQSLSARSQQLAGALGWQEHFDTDRAALDNLRKSLRLVERLRPNLEQVFQRAKPNVITQIFRAVSNDVEKMDQDWRDDGERLRKSFAKERDSIQEEIRAVAEQFLQRLRLHYQQALEQSR